MLHGNEEPPGQHLAPPSSVRHGRDDNRPVRTERWRYTRCKNGDEERYDHKADPDEYHTLAHDGKYRSTMADLAKWSPKEG
jgi:hypothetical protein